MPNLMAALRLRFSMLADTARVTNVRINIGSAVCSTTQSFADTQYWSAVQ